MQPRADQLRLCGMRMTVVALGLVVLTGCGASAGSGDSGRPCTLIGANPGISLDVAPRPGQVLDSAEVTACWGPDCRTWHTGLHPATAAEPQGCTGTAPGDTCSARLRPTGGWYAFVDVPGLREGPVEITVALHGNGTELARTTQNTAAQPVYQNGPECGGGVPQVRIQV